MAGGGRLLIKIEGGGGGFRGGVAGGGRAPRECLWGGGGGELNIFFGAEMPTKEGNLPLRGSLTGGLSETFRGS